MEQWPSFEKMCKLAKEQPSELENWRKAEVERIIMQASEPARRRLKGLQFQIDCERQKHSSAMGACIAISKKMHESLNALNGAILNNQVPKSVPPTSSGNAQIIDFPQRA